jgi:hypothetical protein
LPPAMAAPHQSTLLLGYHQALGVPSDMHGRRLDTEIRRVVLLAKLRPVLEHCSTVWHAATDAQRSQLEGVMLRVMKRFLAVFENVHQDVLRMELGCRSLSSWMAQRALDTIDTLEYGFRLQRMPADRLPAAVNAAVQTHMCGGGCRVQVGHACVRRSWCGWRSIPESM